MSDDKDEKSARLESEMAKLRKAYLARWPERREKMEAAAQEAREKSGSTKALEELRREFHNLAGNGATYGFPEVSHKGREAENFVISVLESGATSTPETSGRIAEFIASLDGILSPSS